MKRYSYISYSIRCSWGYGSKSIIFNVRLPNITGQGIIRNYQSASSSDNGTPFGFDSYGGALGPNITGDLYSTTTANFGVQTTGCFNHAPSDAYSATGPHGGVHIDFYASRSSGIYGKSATVQPNALNLNVLIKY